MKPVRGFLICAVGLFLAESADASPYGERPCMKAFGSTDYPASHLCGVARIQSKILPELPPRQSSHVPEPGTWALLLVGAGLVGLKLRRQLI